MTIAQSGVSAGVGRYGYAPFPGRKVFMVYHYLGLFFSADIYLGVLVG